MAQPNEPSTSCFKRCEYLVSSQDEQDGILSSATPPREKTPEPNWYIRFLSRYPAVVIVVVLVIVGTSGGVTLGTKDMPDFGDPLKGFSTRGTQIYKTTKTAIDVLDAYTLQPPIARVAITNGTGNGQRRKRSVGDVCSELNIKDGNAWTTKLVLESSTSGNLLTTASLRGICDFVDKLIKPNIPNFACPAVSVASRLAELRGKTCSQLDDDDVSYARNLLDECVQFYKSGKLKQNATATPEDRAVVSGSCYEADFVYNVMYYFADVGFYVKSHDLKYTIVYIHYPIHEQTNFSDVDKTFFQDHVEGKTIDNDIVKLVTVGFNNHEDTKYALFEGYLIRDLTYFGLAILLIGLFTLIYLLSFVLVVSTFINIVLSYCFAYFLYYNVCQMVFFPFINLMALLLLVAVGADDVFVFYDTWLQVKEEHPTWSVDQRMSNTFSHAIMSIFVTSFTTVAAFLANVVSDITAIQCFGIFAALAIAANFVMMVTIMPAIVVASDACSAHVTCPCNASTFGAFYRIPKKAYSWVMARLKSFFKTALPTVIRRAWWFCIAVGLALGLAALLIIFYKPALKPPTTKEFQLLSKDNALEKWDLDFKHRFPAEIAAVNKHEHIFVTIVFGFEATDPGNRLNPDDKTKALSRDSDFDMDRTNTRDWLSKLYDNIKNATFADSDFNYLSYLVSDEDMVRHVIKFACYTYRKYGVSNETAAFANMCCLGSVNATVVQSCMDQSRRHGLLRDATSKNIRGSSAGSPIYDTNSLPTDSSVLGFRLDVHTNLNYSVSYEEMRVSYEVLSNFMKTKLESAPEGLRSGFVGTNGYFEFYDLQHSLATGTLKSVALSIGVSFLVLLMTVRNVLITIYAMLTIVLSIACTVASIVLMGWKLNIVESMTITLAVGMSIDFTIHYGVVYQLSRETTSAERTRQSVERVGSAVAAAAWTTFSAGIAVLNCSVDPYRKLGIFLVLVMMFSWVYSTFFFLSLCHIIGPAGNFCQIPCPTTLARRTKNNSTVSDMDLGTIRNNVQ